MTGTRSRRWVIQGMVWTVLAARVVAQSPGPLLSLNPRVTNVIQPPREVPRAVGWWSNFAVTEAVPLGEGETTSSGVPLSGSANPRWRIVLPPETPTGLGVVRWVPSQSPAITSLVLIDRLPTASEIAGPAQKDRAHALLLHPPVASEGEWTGVEAHYFRLELAANEPVNLEVVAQRLGREVDPLLRILSADGTELARANDSDGSGLDPWLKFTAPAAGSYLVEVTDLRQPPGNHRQYRLRVGGFEITPLVWLPEAPLLSLPGPVPPTAEVRVVTGPPVNGVALPNSLPLRLNGRSRPVGARDAFTFTAEKDQRWRVELADRRIGSVGDFIARIETMAGRVLAETDLNKPDAAILNFSFPAKGGYRLVVEEIKLGGGPGFDYEVEVHAGGPDFLLQLTDTHSEVAVGGTATVGVKIQRRGYDGPLKLAVQGLPPGIEIEGADVATKANEATLKLKLPADLSARGEFLLGVTGAAEIGGSHHETRASTRNALKKIWTELNEPPPVMDGAFWLLIKP